MHDRVGFSVDSFVHQLKLINVTRSKIQSVGTFFDLQFYPPFCDRIIDMISLEDFFYNRSFAGF